jgi:hypothetical protein
MSMVSAGAASLEAPESRKSVAIKMRPARAATFLRNIWLAVTFWDQRELSQRCSAFDGAVRSRSIT